MADVEVLLEALTLEEKAALTAGEDMFSTVAVERLGIPKIQVTDGPNGARGPGFPGMGGEPSTCIPCGSAIGAAWDPALAEDLGALVGREALARGYRGLLAPTVNLHRSLLAGRNFECYSEDPLLSGRLAAGYVHGVQSTGVFATVKHFVGNDAEFERTSISSVIDERALRELYLVPFEIAVREGGVLAVMSSYNRLNGRWLTEQPEFLIGILREEWGFEGLVMTDWFAVADRATSLGAGLDLEMPGPGRSLGSTLVDAIEAGIVGKDDLDNAVRRLLGGLDRSGALDAALLPSAPLPPGPEDVALLRRAAAGATVLLSNDGTLPIDPSAVGRVAVLGAHASVPRIMGGGSAQVIAHPFDTPLEAVKAALGVGADVVHERGCEVDRSAAVVGGAVLHAPEGFQAEVYAGVDFEGPVVERRELASLRMAVLASMDQGLPSDGWCVRARGMVVPEEDGLFQLALAQSGRARLFVDGVLVIDGFASPPPPGGDDFFGMASQDLLCEVTLVRGRPVEMVVEYARVDTQLAGFRVGFRTVDGDALMDRAVSAAADADVAVVFAGTTEEWETEGRDRPSLELPGRQTELIRRVAAVNQRTVVVLNAGAPLDLSWEEDVAAVLQCWFGGQEMAAAVADILVGHAEPGGRLATTIPLRLEHSPAYDNFPGENGELRYGEGLFMGYRGYEHRVIAPRFPFGHGLSYTTFRLGEPALSASTFRPGESLTVSVPVTNMGDRAGSEVVQCYVAPGPSRLARPPKELKAFAKVQLQPGETRVVDLQLGDRAFAYWDPGQADWDQIAPRIFDMFGGAPGQERRAPGWQIDPGPYQLLIGRSSQDITTRCDIEVKAQ